MFYVSISYPDTTGYDTHNVPRSDFFWRVRDCRKRLPTAIKNIVQLYNNIATTAKETLKHSVSSEYIHLYSPNR